MEAKPQLSIDEKVAQLRSKTIPLIPINGPKEAASKYDAKQHYHLNVGPTNEYGDSEETPPNIKNIGWTLGNDCPYRCNHCYSFVARERGEDMTKPMVDRVMDQLAVNGVETVNLGGNEPLFTNGPDPKNTLLPYIIEGLTERSIPVGITTSGISLVHLYRDHRGAYDMLNDVDISFDSPFKEEHNANRGADLFRLAMQAMEICKETDKPHSTIMAAMNWNFSISHIEALVELATQYNADVRINPLKPVESKHMDIALSPEQYYEGFSRLMELCDPVDLGEPPIAAVTQFGEAKRCPCGRTSFRIHSITPEGTINVSPCVYLHDFKAPMDLLKNDLKDIINSPQFKVFRQRNANPDMIEGCQGCDLADKCGGGCAARSYLYRAHETGEKTMMARDPYCPKEIQPTAVFPQNPKLKAEQLLVHADYLCTWIGQPKALN